MRVGWNRRRQETVRNTKPHSRKLEESASGGRPLSVRGLVSTCDVIREGNHPHQAASVTQSPASWQTCRSIAPITHPSFSSPLLTFFFPLPLFLLYIFRLQNNNSHHYWPRSSIIHRKPLLNKKTLAFLSAPPVFL
jgi:hypothetical protein